MCTSTWSPLQTPWYSDMSYLVVIIGADSYDYPGIHPFSNGDYIRIYPTANNIHTTLRMLSECDLTNDLLIFEAASIVDSRIIQVIDNLDPSADIAFLGDCRETLLAPRFVNKSPGSTQIRVFAPCCMSAVYIRSRYISKLKNTTDNSTMTLSIHNDLSNDITRGVRVYPPIIHCTPTRPHHATVVNMTEVGRNNPILFNSYILLFVMLAIVILIVICIVMLVRGNRCKSDNDNIRTNYYSRRLRCYDSD